MSKKGQDLPSELAQARQQLNAAQVRVAELEAQLFEDQPDLAALQTTNEDRYLRTLDNMLEGCQILGFDWRYLYINDMAASHGRKTKEELLGNTIMESYPGIENTEVFTALRRCMQERTVEQMENEFVYADGAKAWFELRMQPVPEGIFVLSLDITQRKLNEAALLESEERLRLFVEHAPAAIAMFDQEMTYLSASQRWIEDYRLGDQQVIGRSHYDVFPEIPDRWREIHRRCLNGAVEKSEADLFPRVDGTEDWVRWEIHPWKTGSGDIGGVVLFSELITARVRAEEALKRYAQRLETLHEIDRGIIEAESLEELFSITLKHIRETVTCQRAGVIIFEQQPDGTQMISLEISDPAPASQTLRSANASDWVSRLGTARVKVIADLQALPESIPAYEHAANEGMRSILHVLLASEGQPVGLLNLFANTPDFFTPEYQEIAIEIANQLAIAIHQRYLSDELQQHAEAIEEARNFLQTTLNAVPANITVLEPDGTIIAINLPWQQFADENDAQSPGSFLGANYLAVCENATGSNSEDAAQAAAGIRAVINGEQDEFYLEYPCHSPTTKRWFMLGVTPFSETAPRRVVAAHLDVTERRLAQEAEHEQRVFAEALRDSLAVLTASQDVKTVMEQILDHSAKVIPSKSGVIILYEGDKAHVAYTRGYSAEADAFFKNNPVERIDGLFATRSGNEDYYLVADTKSTPGWLAFPYTEWIRSSIGVSIKLHNQTIGALVVDSTAPNKFEFKDVEKLQTFARYAALAIENAQHVEQLETRVDERTLELQAALERVEAILNNSADGIVLVDADLTIQQSNAAFNQLFACETDDYFNQPLTTLFPVENDDRIAAALQQVLSRGQVTNIEVRARRHDKTEFDAELSIGHIKDDGFVCSIRDITERKEAEEAQRQSEEKFRLLVDSAPIAVVITNRDGQMVIVNSQAERLFGYHRSQMVGQPVEMLVPEDLHRQHILHRTGYMAKPSMRPMGIGLELQARRRDNTLFPVEVQLSYIEMQDDILVMSYIADITERKKAEQTLLLALAKERELNELKTRFVSMASHEFRTPLATILALTETLSAYRHKLSEEQIDQRFDRIKVQVDHLKDIMEDVLLLARMQARRVEFNPVRVDLDGLCRSVIDEFQGRVDVSHRINYSFSNHLHDVMLDKKLMRQIINNLVSNAIKYSPPDKPVYVILTHDEKDIILTVRDEGMGIPQADLPHLFEAFHRAGNVGVISGTGLGLVITKESVELHGGTITIDSQLDVGTTVTVRIPIFSGRVNYNDKNSDN